MTRLCDGLLALPACLFATIILLSTLLTVALLGTVEYVLIGALA